MLRPHQIFTFSVDRVLNTLPLGPTLTPAFCRLIYYYTYSCKIFNEVVVEGQLRLVTLEQYTKLERPQLQWLIPGLIPRPGWILLLGEPKAGKSTFALQLALAVAQGKSFFPQVSTRQGRVLFLQLDTSELVWRKRILDVAKVGQDITGPVLAVHPEDELRPLNILDLSVQNWLKEAIALAAPALIVTDVLRELHNADENDSSSMKVAGDVLYQLTRGYATLLLHHSKKMEAGSYCDPIQASRGSSYITGKADSVWMIHENSLRIVPRFAERKTYTMLRGGVAQAGLWSFTGSSPSLSLKEEVEQGLWGLEKDKFGNMKRVRLGDPTPHALPLAHAAV